MISFVTGEEYVSDRSPANKEEDLILVEYLSGLTLKEGEKEELLLSDEELPTGYCIIYKRRCRRTLFSNDEDFTIIVSKETACTLEGKNKEYKVTKIMCCSYFSFPFPCPFLSLPFPFFIVAFTFLFYFLRFLFVIFFAGSVR